jgi:hypothetical protein
LKYFVNSESKCDYVIIHPSIIHPLINGSKKKSQVDHPPLISIMMEKRQMIEQKIGLGKSNTRCVTDA